MSKPCNVNENASLISHSKQVPNKCSCFFFCQVFWTSGSSDQLTNTTVDSYRLDSGSGDIVTNNDGTNLAYDAALGCVEYERLGWEVIGKFGAQDCATESPVVCSSPGKMTNTVKVCDNRAIPPQNYFFYY